MLKEYYNQSNFIIRLKGTKNRFSSLEIKIN